jgi:hypothetical protein
MDITEYKTSVPRDVTEFALYAQAKNPMANLALAKTFPTEGDDDSEIGFDTELTLAEGLNTYTITVTPQEGESPAKIYTLNVIKLPNLSLKTFKLTGNNSFEQSLAQISEQTVYVLENAVTVVAEVV